MTDNTDLLDDKSETNKDIIDSSTISNDTNEDIVVGNKKYKNMDELVKSRLEADRFIETLKQEKKVLQEQLESTEKLKAGELKLTEILDKIQKASDTGKETPALSKDDLSKLIEEQFVQREIESKKDQNRKNINNIILSKFGNDASKAKEYLDKKANSLSLTKTQLKQLAEGSPQAFITLFDLEAKKQEFSASSFVKPDINSSAIENSPTGERNFDYYNSLRKKLGTNKFYANLEIQKQKTKDMERLGDKFFKT